MQRYTILLFGPAASALGLGRVSVEADSVCSCRELKVKMAEAHPTLAGFIEAGRLAVDQAFAGDDEAVDPGAEIALISMVSGG